jgi:hypothetical protein
MAILDMFPRYYQQAHAAHGDIDVRLLISGNN